MLKFFFLEGLQLWCPDVRQPVWGKQKINKKISSMALKPINIRWIRTCSQSYWKIMFSIVLQTIFHKYLNKNHKINKRFVSTGLRPLRVNKTSFNLIFFYFDIIWKLSKIRCDKYLRWSEGTLKEILRKHKPIYTSPITYSYKYYTP